MTPAPVLRLAPAGLARRDVVRDAEGVVTFIAVVAVDEQRAEHAIRLAAQ